MTDMTHKDGFYFDTATGTSLGTYKSEQKALKGFDRAVKSVNDWCDQANERKAMPLTNMQGTFGHVEVEQLTVHVIPVHPYVGGRTRAHQDRFAIVATFTGTAPVGVRWLRSLENHQVMTEAEFVQMTEERLQWFQDAKVEADKLRLRYSWYPNTV